MGNMSCGLIAFSGFTSVIMTCNPHVEKVHAGTCGATTAVKSGVVDMCQCFIQFNKGSVFLIFFQCREDKLEAGSMSEPGHGGGVGIY